MAKKKDTAMAIVRDLAKRPSKHGVPPWTIIPENADLIHRARTLLKQAKKGGK